MVLLHLDIFSMIYSNYYLTPGESLKKSMKTNKLEDFEDLEGNFGISFYAVIYGALLSIACGVIELKFITTDDV